MHMLSETRTDLTAIENQEWLESFDYILETFGTERATALLELLHGRAAQHGVRIPLGINTPYLNTIAVEQQPAFPGNETLEQRIENILRWNAMAMVVKANKNDDGIGGHIATYASCATLFEVGLNHFFRGKESADRGDIVYFQGHASPGIYARAYLEGRLTEHHLEQFRHELHKDGGLSSYPHPKLMPEFWEYPTVSMGLAPYMAVYQARFNRYLEHRGFKDTSKQKIWSFLGDGEMDEPESVAAISLAAREGLDNLIYVINCNLQRLDGPVRGNGRVVQELERMFRGVGWNVIKIMWSSDWDPILAADREGLLAKRFLEIPDGQFQNYAAADGAQIRKDFFGNDPRLEALVAHMSDEQIKKLRRGGHDQRKVYAAFKSAVEHKGAPTLILSQTIKGYGMGKAGEGQNTTHQQKKLKPEEVVEFRNTFNVPLSDEDTAKLAFYKPADDSEEIRYLKERRAALGGPLPARLVQSAPLTLPASDFYDEFLQGSEGREVSSTMVFVNILSKLLRDANVGKHIVPIIPDEARTFGMEALFRRVGIYSPLGQRYTPVDQASLLYYKEAKDGAILEEGICEAGAFSSFVAAGTSYVSHGIPMLPFYIFYSMFGLQRIADFAWAAADMQCKGFLLGATAGRTTLAGEGLQHQDGNSHLFAYPFPSMPAYDPAFAYELAVIIEDGLDRMYRKNEDLIYYITLMNENYPMPAMPKGCKDGILKGLYKFSSSDLGNKAKAKASLIGAGTILTEVIKARDILETQYGVAADVWSATSFKALHDDALAAERYNRLNPDKKPKMSHIEACLGKDKGVVVAATDYVKALPYSVANWIPGTFVALGTDGYGRSENRAALRDYFEVDAKHIVFATLEALVRDGALKPTVLKEAMKALSIRADKPHPGAL